MSRRRRRSSRGAAAAGTGPQPDQRPFALVGFAFGIALLCILPFLLWGNPYDAFVLRYWSAGGATVLLVGMAAARLPATTASPWPARLASGLLRPSPGVFAVLLGLATTALCLGIAYRAFDRGTTTSDEVAQLWHAKMLAHGWLSLPADSTPEFFAIDNVIDQPRWYSHFPIGGPLALLPGVLIGAPWLVNPVLAGGAAAAFFHFSRRVFGELEGRSAAVLFALTPGILFLSATYMNHTPTMFLAMCALAAVAEWDRASGRPRLWWAAAIGACVSGMATIRPLDGVVAALAIGAFQIHRTMRERERVDSLVAGMFGGAVALSPLLITNWLLNGSPLRFGYEVMWGEGHGVGFGADPHGNVHTIGRALEYAVTYVGQLNFHLMLWPLPAMVLVAVGLFAMRRMNRWDALMCGFVGLQLAAYAAYWGFGDLLGPRFLYTVYPPIVLLLTRGLFALGSRDVVGAGRGVIAAVVAAIVIAWTAPAAYGVRGVINQVRGTRQALRIDLPDVVREAKLTNAVLFIRESMSSRLLHRLWGLGVSRNDAATLMETRDACSLLAAVRDAQAMSGDRARERTALLANAAPFRPTEIVRTSDPQFRVSSASSLTPACRTELENERFVAASFGIALPHESIGPDGRLSGDVIYAMDLGDHNEALRARFGERQWYRLVVSKAPGGSLRAAIEPY